MTKPASLSSQDSLFSWLSKVSVQPEVTHFSSFKVLNVLYVVFYAFLSVSSGLSYIRDKKIFILGTTLEHNFDMFWMKQKSGMLLLLPLVV